MSEIETLNEQISRGWGDIPGDRIPENWREVPGPGHVLAQHGPKKGAKYRVWAAILDGECAALRKRMIAQRGSGRLPKGLEKENYGNTKDNQTEDPEPGRDG